MAWLIFRLRTDGGGSSHRRSQRDRHVRFWIILLAVLSHATSSWAQDESLSFERFGTVTVYHGDAEPEAVVLFVSGDGGWNQGVVDMARQLAALGALVVGIDIVTYLKEVASTDDKCTYAAGDFERLSQFIQKKFAMARYRAPVLVGYSSGATLVYATLVQAPTGTFRGGISLGFCPDLRTAKPMCAGRGLTWADSARLGSVYEPSATLETPWTALNGDIDQVCSLAETRAFVERVKNGKLVELAHVGHGFSVQRNWLPQFKAAFTLITNDSATSTVRKGPSVGGLPLVEVPAATIQGPSFAILLTGDGGWAGLDRQLGAALAAKGVPVVGFDSLRYFWTRRSPEEAAADLARVIRHYTSFWRKSQVILIGYSFGADVMPFLVRRLAPELRAQIDRVVLLGPSQSATFEFRVSDWLGGRHIDTLPVKPEAEFLQDLPLLCVYGREEKESLCRDLAAGRTEKLEMKGGHHFSGEIAPIVDAILNSKR